MQGWREFAVCAAVLVLALSPAGAQVPFGFEPAEVSEPVLCVASSAAFVPDDPDRDCLDNADEALHGSDPLDPDTDGDLLLDGMDILYDPTGWDDDGDQIPDYIEHHRGGGALSPGADSDLDGPDRNHDGTPDELLTNLMEYRYGRPDDWNEATMGPWLWGSAPLEADTDADGVRDGDEVDRGSNPNLPDSEAATGSVQPLLDDDLPGHAYDVETYGARLGDFDRDGLTWRLEWARGSDPWTLDSDGDGLCDGGGRELCPLGEVHWHTNPGDPDSDGDSLPDGVEALLWLTPPRTQTTTASTAPTTRTATAT